MSAIDETHHSVRWPNESPEYRTARDRLLEAEMALRRQIEEVAALRRALPPGGFLLEDYVFEEGPEDLAQDGPTRPVRLSELFAEGQDTLVLYGLMYRADGNPCPGCTGLLDGLSGSLRQITERVSFAVIGKAPVAMLRRWAVLRRWPLPRLLSSAGNTYNRDYHTETAEGEQQPILNVFRRGADGIRHVWASELFFVPPWPAQHPRHLDALWPLWPLLDFTPGGRGDDMPMASYRESLEQLHGGATA